MTIPAKLTGIIRTGILASLTTVALTVTTPLFAQSSFISNWYDSQNFSVDFTDEKLTIKGNNIPVKTLLLEIQELTGIKVNFVSGPSDKVTLDVDAQSVESVIAKISDNHMIIHANVNGTKTISELIIIAEGTTEVASADNISEFLPTGEPAPQIAAATPDRTNTELTDKDAEQNL